MLQVIVKSGDDCRQEHLAVQLISHFYGKLFVVKLILNIILTISLFLIV
jgi:phosphatidylinositol kinase/protein kinase (PI-3  family)